jgi:hypothetical protein
MKEIKFYHFSDSSFIYTLIGDRVYWGKDLKLGGECIYSSQEITGKFEQNVWIKVEQKNNIQLIIW